MKWIILIITSLLIVTGVSYLFKLNSSLNAASGSVSIGLGSSPLVDRFVPDDVIKKSIKTFSRLIDSSNFSEFGFENTQQIKDLKAGKQYKKYFIELYKIINYNGFDSIHQLCNRNYSIEIPLEDAGKAITSIEYKLNQSDKWQAFGFGSSSVFKRFISSPLDTTIHDIFLVDVPALNVGFYYFRDPATGELKSIFANYIDVIKSSAGLSDRQMLDSLKQLSSKINLNYPL